MRTLCYCAGLVFLGLAPPLGADDGKKVESKAHQVPFKLTNTKHVLVRAKINGKGPYNFIIDTGAPALFVSTAVAKKLGVKPDKKGWGTFDRFDLEGGVSLAKFKGRIEDPFQLQGMNALGLAGAELHGIIGYMVLAKFKIELDFTRDKMTWTPSKFQPPPPEGLGGRGGAPAELDALGGVMKFLGAFLGKKPEADITTRGLLGIDLIDESVGVVVKTVFEKGPAARAGLKAGDLIVEFQGRTVRDYDGLQKLAAKVSAGDTVKLTIKREGKKQTITFKSEEGL